MQEEAAGVLCALHLPLTPRGILHQQHGVPLDWYVLRLARQRVDLYRGNSCLRISCRSSSYRVVAADGAPCVGDHLLILQRAHRQALAERLRLSAVHDRYAQGAAGTGGRGGRTDHSAQLHDALCIVRRVRLRHQQAGSLPKDKREK